MNGLGAMGGGSDNESSYGASEIQRQEMSGPQGVDDILSQLAPKKAAGTVKEIHARDTNQRLANVTKATPDDLQQHGHTMRKMDTTSSGYRRKVTDGMKLNI